jgi:hypothetical protein
MRHIRGFAHEVLRVVVVADDLAQRQGCRGVRTGHSGGHVMSGGRDQGVHIAGGLCQQGSAGTNDRNQPFDWIHGVSFLGDEGGKVNKFG